MATYKHLFFDLDHTLWDFERNSTMALEQIWKSGLSKHLEHVPFAHFMDSYTEVNEHWWGLYRKEQVSKEELRVGRFADSMKRFGLVDYALADQVATSYLELGPYMKHLHEGAIDLLQDLQEKDFQMHIITNGFEEVQHIKLRESGLRNFFKEIITSEAAGAKKPNPSIFHFAMQKSGAVMRESLMIGDSLGSDILGAQGVGMDQVFFNPKAEIHDVDPTYEIQRLSEIRGILGMG